MSRRAAGRIRRVAVVTGTRAEYGSLCSPMRAIAEHPRLRLQLVVTGMHLLKRFGHTVDQIVADGWRIAARIPMQRGDDDPLDQAAGLARGVEGLARFFEQARSDIVVVLGDRIEALAGALAAVTTGRCVAHIHGGDVAAGDFDESLRHAITRLAHLHLAATRRSARRIVRMGEQPWRVHLVGAPGLDRARELLQQTPRPPAPTGQTLVVQHAYGRPAEVERRTALMILDALAAAGLRRIVLYPNTDRGHRGVLRAIEQHRRRWGPQQVEVHRSLPRDDYLRLLIRCDLLIGNSSSGIIEAPLLGVPSIDVGTRQAGREPGGRSVLRVPERPRAIRDAIARARRMRPRRGGRSVYGDGRAGQRIADVLARVSLTPELLRKQITY